MIIKIIRYSILGLALFLALGLLVNTRRAYNESENSLTTELPARQSEPTISVLQSTVSAPKTAGQALNFKPLVPTFVSNALANKKEYPVITLGKANTIVFRNVITPQSIAGLQAQLIAMSLSLSASTPIYLVLDTPGGDIDAGEFFINTAKAIPQEVITITQFSASMGFHTVQNLGQRLITPSGTLMSHRAAIDGLAGHIPGEAVVRMNKILTQVNEMDKVVAKRVGMKYEDYQALVHDEYWISGADAVRDHMADKVVLLACAKDLTGTYTQKMSTIFGTMSIEWSNCPAITYPIGLDAEQLFQHITKQSNKEAVFNFINEFLNNKEQFTKDYIINSSYKKFIY